MEEGLDANNILSDVELENLFTEEEEDTSTQDDDNEEVSLEPSVEGEIELDEGISSTTNEGDSEEADPKEVEPSTKDTDDKSGDGRNSKTVNNKASSNFYSSITKAFKEDGILPDLDSDTIESIKDAKDFSNLIETQLQNRLEEKQKRIDEALNYGVKPSEINQYENTLNYLDSIKEDTLVAEDDKSELLRKQLIYQDFVNRGYSESRAKREVEKSMTAGTDIEDAKDALMSNKELFKSRYNELIENSRKEKEAQLQENEKLAKELKESILKEDKAFGEISMSNNIRKKVYDNISKPVYKDPKTGNLYTAIQKYEMENKNDFIKNVGIIYTLTDGFKNINNLVKSKVNKEINKGIKELQHTLNNTARDSGGALKFSSGASSDPESLFSNGWEVNIK